MSVYENLAIILPNATIVIDPGMTFKHYYEQLFEKIKNGEMVQFVSTTDDTCVIYKHVEGIPLTIMTEKMLTKIRNEQRYAMAAQQGLPLIKQQ